MKKFWNWMIIKGYGNIFDNEHYIYDDMGQNNNFAFQSIIGFMIEYLNEKNILFDFGYNIEIKSIADAITHPPARNLLIIFFIIFNSPYT